ncbi:MMPL family transporter [Aquabacterium sp.]|uniref:MMPL family transporter n=1 Tax=Aquabacterium sp. TaxID=1872578 RepID=UPI002CDD61EE|nr:MMPL family transporter [Aquabacterium sp.]HSW06634.1 MMPL family transporter [Aquabacterium sp.]
MTDAPLSPARRATALLLWLAVMLLGGWVIARSSFSADLSAFLPASPDPRQRVLIEQIQSGVAARTLMLGITGGDALQRAEASNQLASALRDSGLFDQVHNGNTATWQASGAGEWLFANRYHLSPAVEARHFTVDGLREAFDDTLSLLGTPAGAAIKPLLESDPTGETRRIVEAMLPPDAPRSQHGVWVSRQLPRAVLLAQTRAAGGDLDGQAALLAQVRAAFAKISAQPGLGVLQLQLSGPPVFAVDSRAQIEREVIQLAIVGTLLMGVVLLLAFASLPAVAVAFVPVASGVVGGVVAVSLGFGTVHGITLGFGSTLIGEAVDYAIYYLIQARGAAQPGTGWLHWRRLSWPTVRLGLLTSMCGFAALMFSGFPGLAQLGVFSLSGLLAAALATRFVLPALMPDGAAGLGLRRWLGEQAARALRWLPRARMALLVLGAVSLGLLLWQRGELWRGDLASLSPVSRSALALDANLRADLSASDARTLVVVPGTDAQAALQAAELAGAKLDALVAQGRLAGYDSPARWLPSISTQQARLASLPDANTLGERVKQAAAGGPLKAERLQPFVDAVQQARQRPPVDRAALQGSPLAPLVDALLFEAPADPKAGGARWRAMLSLQPGPPAGPGGKTGQPPLDAEQLRAALADVPGLQVVDIKQELDGLYQRYLREAVWQALLGGLAVVLLLAVAMRSTRRLLAVCLPLALAVLLTLGGLMLAQVALGILHLVGLLLVVAVGSNYALFFDQFSTEGAADADTLASLVLANLTTVLSFGLIGLSHIPALSAIGQVVAPGALLALLLSAAFVPARRAAAAPTMGKSAAAHEPPL